MIIVALQQLLAASPPMALVSSPSKGIKRDRDGVNLGDGSSGVAVKSQSNALVNKFYVSFVNDAIEKKREASGIEMLWRHF